MRTMTFAVAMAVAVLALTARPSSQTTLASGPAVTGQIIVAFAPGAGLLQKAEAHQQAGGVRLAEIAQRNVQLVGVPAGAESASIIRYERNPNVLYAEPNFIRRVPEPTAGEGTIIPGDHWFYEEYGLHNVGQLFYCILPGLCFYVGTPDADIDAPEAWAISEGSPTVTVAVIDTGIDYTHPDLQDRYDGGYDYIHLLNGEPTFDPMDDYGHGTHVAGTIAASISNLTGPVDNEAEEGAVGVAPLVRLRAYKVCDAGGACSDFGIQQAIAQAAADGAKVINMSLGETTYSQSFNDAVQGAWNQNVVIVAGAGNEGNTAPFYPAAFPNVLAIAAYDEDHKQTSFTTYGSWVELSAPGQTILSTYPLWGCGGLGGVPGDTGCYAWNSGTSMATPHAAGVAALVWSRPDVQTNAQVRTILLNSADARGVGRRRLDSWTQYGGVNAYNALTYGLTNAAPVANAGPDQNVVDSDDNGSELIQLNGSATDDGDLSFLSYEWSEGGTPFAFTASTSKQLDVGVHTLTLLVRDADNATDTDDVVITISAGGSPPSATDTVAITKASYNSRRGQLSVEATSTDAPSASLTVYDATNSPSVEIGPLLYNAKRGTYTGNLNWPQKPVTIEVLSSSGGTATSGVSGK